MIAKSKPETNGAAIELSIAIREWRTEKATVIRAAALQGARIDALLVVTSPPDIGTVGCRLDEARRGRENPEGGICMIDAFLYVLRKRSGEMLDKIADTLRAVDEKTLAEPKDGWPLWKQFYHLLYWLEYWFVDPLSFSPPAFHEDHYMEPRVISPRVLTKQQLQGYHGEVKARIERYLSDVTGEQLQGEFEVRGQKRLRLEMIGQFSHVSHHLGYICATVRALTGESIWRTA